MISPFSPLPSPPLPQSLHPPISPPIHLLVPAPAPAPTFRPLALPSLGPSSSPYLFPSWRGRAGAHRRTHHHLLLRRRRRLARLNWYDNPTPWNSRGATSSLLNRGAVRTSYAAPKHSARIAKELALCQSCTARWYAVALNIVGVHEHPYPTQRRH